MIKLSLTSAGLKPSAFDPDMRDLARSVPGVRFDRASGCYTGAKHAIEALTHAAIESKLAKLVGSLDALRPVPQLAHVRAPHTGLREYQQAGADWLVRMCLESGAALLADEMGLGKTPQAIRAAEVLLCRARFRDPAAHVLVVCPAVMVRRWVGEVERWRTSTETTVEAIDCSRATKTRQPKPPSCGFRVISYDMFRKRAPDLDAAALLIFDEAHYLCNQRSQRTSAARSFAARCRDEARASVIMLTGTPLATRPRDLFALLEILEPGEPPHPGAWGGYWAFTKRYCAGEYVEIPGLDRAVWQVDGSSHEGELARRLDHIMLRREKRSVGDLPPRVLNVVPIELPAKAKAARKRTAALFRGVEQVEALLADAEDHKVAAAVELAETVRSNGGRALILTIRKETARKVAEALGVGYVTGDVEASKRESLLVDAPHGVATMFSIMTGINLTCYDTVIFCGLWWQPPVIQQAMDRPHRIGQTRTVNVHFLVGLGTVDEAIQHRVIERLDASAEILRSEDSSLAATLAGEDEDLIAGLVKACERGEWIE